jgi:hypothetical protein
VISRGRLLLPEVAVVLLNASNCIDVINIGNKVTLAIVGRVCTELCLHAGMVRSFEKCLRMSGVSRGQGKLRDETPVAYCCDPLLSFAIPFLLW